MPIRRNKIGKDAVIKEKVEIEEIEKKKSSEWKPDLKCIKR